MSNTNINLTPEVIGAIYDMQQRGDAELFVGILQRVLNGIIRYELGDEKERLNLAADVLCVQDTLRCFIPTDEKGGI